MAREIILSIRFSEEEFKQLLKMAKKEMVSTFMRNKILKHD